SAGLGLGLRLRLGGRGGRGGGRARSPALYPAGDVALAAAGDAHGARRHVVGDDAARRGVGAVADRHRRDEHVAGPGAGVPADRAAVLGDPVVVDEHRGGADVRALADRRVTAVGQVRHLYALADTDDVSYAARARLWIL